HALADLALAQEALEVALRAQEVRMDDLQRDDGPALEVLHDPDDFGAVDRAHAGRPDFVERAVRTHVLSLHVPILERHSAAGTMVPSRCGAPHGVHVPILERHLAAGTMSPYRRYRHQP